MKILILAGCLILSIARANAAGINGALSLQGDTVHLEFTGQQNWDYDMKRLDRNGQTVVELVVPALAEETVKNLSSFKSEMVTAVSVDRKGPDGKYIVRLSLAGESIDTFDYLTDQPSRLIVDFFVNPASRTAQKNKSEVKTDLVDNNSKPLKTVQKKETGKQRKPATSDALSLGTQGFLLAKNDPVKAGIFDGGDPDYDRFAVKDYEMKEDAVIRSRDNYYIPFPMLEPVVAYWEKLRSTPAIYEVSRQSSEENKQARLLLTLFEKKRFAVYLKSVQWFKEKYPESEYSEVIDYMTADVYLILAQEENSSRFFNEAMQKYKEAVQKYPQSPLAERTSLKMAYLTLEKADYLGALRLFKEHIDNKNFANKGSISKDLSRIGTALAFSKLNRWDEAIAQLDEVEKTAENRDLKVDAAYRKGDVWTRAKDYAKAVNEYQAAIKKYPEGQSSYPNAYYNQAESLFLQQKYPQSLEAYREFIKKFPTDDHVAFAMTRLGELLEVFGVDKSRVMGAYLETYFRHGESPKAVVARLRLLSARMKGMKPKEVSHAVSEIMSLAKKIDLPNIEQFATVMVADGYNHRAEYQKAVDLLSKYYKENPTTVDMPLISNRIITNINDKMRSEIDDGKFIDGLKTHSQYADSWLKKSKRLDTRYNLGRAFEMAGAPVEAEKYYKETINKIYAIRGTAEAKEVQVKESIPSEDEILLRLASVSTQEQKFNQAYDYLKSIKNPVAMTEKSQIERVDIAVKLLEKRGDTESAIRYLGELLRTWKGQPELVAEPYLKLADLQKKQNQTAEALTALEMINRLQKDSQKVPAQVHAKALESMGDIYLEQNKIDQAAQAYQDLLEKYEDTRPLSSIRYKLGQIHFKQGAIQKAAEVWNDFKGEKSGFWKDLAQEQLKNSAWRDDYKKYIKRIPAMSENKQGK